MQNVYDVNPFLKEEIDKIASELNYQFDKKIAYSNRYLSLRANIMRKINKSTEDYFGKSLNEFNQGDIVGSVHRNSDITKYKILDITPFEVKIISLSHAFPKAEYQRTKELGEHWELIEPKKSLEEVFKILKEKTPLMPENKNKEIGQNPIKFNIGDIIESIYNKQKYKVIDPDKKGIAKLLNLESNVVQDFNSTSNPHFKLVKKSSGFPTMQYVESPATQDIRVLNKVVAEYIYAKTDEEKLFKKTLIKDQIDTLKKYLSKKEIQDVKKWEGAINGAISSAMSVLNSNVLKPKTETMFKQNIATKPEKLSFDYLLSSNSGDRKSPTQSAGQLRSLYAYKPKYEKELFSTLFKGNDNNWYKLGKDKNNTWRWEKADEQSKEESPAKKVFSNEAFDIDKKISIVKEKGKPLSQFKNGEKVFWANVTQDGNFKSYVEGTVFNKGNEYGIKRFPQNPEAKKYPVANFNSTTRVVLKPENDPIYTGTADFPQFDKKQELENLKYLKKGDQIIVDMGGGKEVVEVMTQFKTPSDVQFISLKRKSGSPYTVTPRKLNSIITSFKDEKTIKQKEEKQKEKIEIPKSKVSNVSKETKIDNYLKTLYKEPISMRNFAKSLIADDVIRGYDISMIKSGSAGKVNNTGWVQIGGYVNGKNITSNKILVEKFKGKTVQEIFSLQELYNEIKNETSDLLKAPKTKDQPSNTNKDLNEIQTEKTNNPKKQSEILEQKWRDYLKANGVDDTSKKLRQELFDFNKKHFPVVITLSQEKDFYTNKLIPYGQVDFNNISGWIDDAPFTKLVNNRIKNNELGDKVGWKQSKGGGSAFKGFSPTLENAKMIQKTYEKAGYKTELIDKLFKNSKQEPKASSGKKDIEDALTGAKAYLKYAKDTEKSDIKAYIRGLEILLK